MDVRDVCVIGGSRYFGRRVIEELLGAGAAVTVINRGSVAAPEGATHLLADRNDETALLAALGDRRFDVVIDQVCYTPVQAAIAARVFAGRTRRYVMTSTVEVYAGLGGVGGVGGVGGPALTEDALDLTDWPVDLELPWDEPEFLDDHYGEGKRQAEAVLLNEAPFAVATVRTAHVLGGTDFTGRLAHYTSRIADGLPVAVHAQPQPASFVQQTEIARFLAWAARGTFTGPVNAASHGALDVHELCAAIGGRTHVAVARPGEPVSPFSFERCYAMDTTRAAQLGFDFSRTADWLPQAIKEVQA